MHSATVSPRIRRPLLALSAAGLALTSIAFVTSPGDAATNERSHQPEHAPRAFGLMGDHAKLSELAAELGIDGQALSQALDTLHQDMAAQRETLHESLSGADPDVRRDAMRELAEQRQTAMTEVLAEFGIDREALRAHHDDPNHRRGEHTGRRRAMMGGMLGRFHTNAHANANVPNGETTEEATD